MEYYKAVLLNVPVELLKRLNEASSVMKISRSELIRRVLTRELEFVFGCEIARVSKSKEEATTDYIRWIREAI
jgi:hypothetical protein